MSIPTTAPVPAAAPAAKTKKSLPPVEHVFDTEAALTTGVADATAKGYEKFATRKFKVVAGSKTVFVMAFNNKDAAGRAVSSGKLDVSVVEIDPSPRSVRTVAPTADAVMSAMSLLSDADREKIAQALAKKKK